MIRYLLISIIFLSNSTYAKNIKPYELGKNIYFEHGCGNCHGTEAEGSSYYPKLANKKEDFLIKKLNDFKNGIALTQKQEIMFTFVKPLDKQDIINLSKYLTNLIKDTSSKYDVEDDLLGVDF